MITFKRYLEEAHWQDYQQTLENFLLDNCLPMMSALDSDLDDMIDGDSCFYRGVQISGSEERIKLIIDGESRTCYIKKVRKDRTPLDTHHELSEMLDDIFKKKFGWKPRSQGLFCATKPDKLGQYGQVYRIYPLGLFSFLYSPNVKDLTDALSKLLADNGLPRQWSGKPHTPEQLETIRPFIEKFIDDSEYTDKNLHDAFGTKRPEIMLDCDKYLVVPIK